MTLCGGLPPQVRNKCALFCVEQCEGKLNEDWIHLLSPLLPAGLSGLPSLQIYVMMVSSTIEYVQCL